jgi:hypothetical protein
MDEFGSSGGNNPSENIQPEPSQPIRKEPVIGLECPGVGFDKLNPEEQKQAGRFLGIMRETLGPLRPAEDYPDFTKIFTFLSDEEQAELTKMSHEYADERFTEALELTGGRFFYHNPIFGKIMAPRDLFAKPISEWSTQDMTFLVHEGVHAVSFQDVKKGKDQIIVRTGVSRQVANLQTGEIKRTRYAMNEILTWHYAMLAHYSHMAYERGESMEDFLKTLPPARVTDETDFDIGLAWGKKVGAETLHQAYFYGKVAPLIDQTNGLQKGAFDQINRAIEAKKLVDALKVIERLPAKKK